MSPGKSSKAALPTSGKGLLVFEELNRRSLKATDKELEKLTLGVADSSISKQDATRFFESHVKR